MDARRVCNINKGAVREAKWTTKWTSRKRIGLWCCKKEIYIYMKRSIWRVQITRICPRIALWISCKKGKDKGIAGDRNQMLCPRRPCPGSQRVATGALERAVE